MNVIPLLKVKAIVLGNPEGFDMYDWDCGTSACFAGWIMRLEGIEFQPDEHDPIEITARVLKLDRDEVARLCYLSLWPAEFKCYDEVHDEYDTNAELAAKYIDYFISEVQK